MRIMVVRHILTGMCIQEICGWSETKWIRMVDDWLNFKPQARWYFIVPIIFMFWRVAHVRHGDGTWWRDHRVVAYFSQFLSHTWMVTCHDPGTETTSGASTLKSSHWAYWVNGKKQNIDFAHPALKVLMKISMLPQTFGTSTHVDGSWLTKSFRFYIFLHILRCFCWEFNGFSRFRNNKETGVTYRNQFVHWGGQEHEGHKEFTSGGLRIC